MKIKIFLIAIVSIALFASCSNKNKFKLAVSGSKKAPEFTKLEKINKKYIEEFGKKFTFELIADKAFLLTTNYKLLSKDSAYDMAVITNINYARKDTLANENTKIRAVLPINSRMFYIAYNKDKFAPNSIEELFENRNVAILSNETVFIKSILADFGVSIEKVNFIMSKSNIGDEETSKLDSAKLDSINKIDFNRNYTQSATLPYDVEVGFASQNFSYGGRLQKFLDARQEFALYSLDDYRLYKSGSKAEGFCLRNKYFTPFLLPKGAYGEFPETPILTIREDFILAAREDVSDEFIYDFVKTAVEETDLIDMSLYGQNFENVNFSFPLHDGTKRYLDKNAPKFYEKYGELLGKIGTGIGGAYTALFGFLLWRKKNRRKTIIPDFQRAVDIRSKLNDNNSFEELEQMYAELQTMQHNYHLKVLEQKILVDETLQIFFDILNKNESFLLDEMKKIKG